MQESLAVCGSTDAQPLLLVDHCSTNMYEQQTMIYPILFCYRHRLEMAMKCSWREVAKPREEIQLEKPYAFALNKSLVLFYAREHP
jgi:hypothetical protein